MNKTAIENNHDYIALSWVKEEIINNLNQAQQVLESLASETSDKDAIVAGLADCFDLLHQVSGALRLVGFPGASIFAEEIKTFCKILINNKVEDFNYSLQVLMQVILQMPSYLEIIQTEGHDIPIALLPLINEMRACYKAAPLSEVELFSSKYYGANSLLTDEELQEINTDGLTNLLRKLRQSLQLSLIDLIHNNNFDLALEHLYKIFNYLVRLCKATPISTLWQVALVFTKGITEKKIANNIETIDLLKQIDLQIKNLVGQGVIGMNIPAPEKLIKELLFLIAQADSDSEEILAIKREFHLNHLLLNANEVNINQTKLLNVDRSVLESVTQALTEEFDLVKDQLDLFTRSGNKSSVDIEILPDVLKRITNILEILGLAEQKKIIDTQLENINKAIVSNHFDATEFNHIAEAILSVEASITNSSNIKDYKNKSTHDAQQAVVREAALEFTQVKDILSRYFASFGEEGDINNSSHLLRHAVGALVMISQQRAAAVVILCLQYIEDKLINSSVFPDIAEIDAIVGAIASIDYYMECLSKNQIVSSKDALNFAIKYLVELGYELPEDYAALITKYTLSISPKAVPEEISKITTDQVTSVESVSKKVKKSIPIVQETPKTVLDVEIDQELVEIFTEEMEEIFDTLSTTIPAWIADTDDTESLTIVRRSFHTIKGSGRMVKATVLSELSWAIENMLNRLIDRTITVSQPVLDLVQDVIKILPELTKEFALGQQHEREDVNYYAAAAHALAIDELPSVQSIVQVAAEPQVEPLEIEENQPITQETTEDYDLVAFPTAETIVSKVKEDTLDTTTEAEDFDVELINIFVVEAKTHMQTLRGFITLCEHSLPQIVTDDLQRAMHTLKGSALMAGLEGIASIAKPFEGFLKDCSINAWPIDHTDLELLQDACVLLNKGIHQLELYSLAPIEGTELLIERIRLRRDYLLSQLEASAKLAINSDDELSPTSIISSLLQYVDVLLDAEDYIKVWQKIPNEQFSQLGLLNNELTKVSATVQQAGYLQVVSLCQILLRTYDAVKANTIIKDDRFFTALLNAHQALLNNIDQLAAAQLVVAYPDEVTQLEQVLTHTMSKEDTTESVQAIAELIPNEVVATNKAPISSYTVEDKLLLGAPAPTGPIIESQDNIDPDIIAIFLEEADEILVEARKNLDNWIENQNPEHLHELQRQLHTLKGGARICGASSLGDIAHGLEFIYEGLLNGHYSYSTDLVKLLNKAHGFIQLIIDTLHDNQILPHNPELLNAIQVFRQEGRVILDDSTATHNVTPSIEQVKIDEPEIEESKVVEEITATTIDETVTPIEEIEAIDEVAPTISLESKDIITELVVEPIEETKSITTKASLASEQKPLIKKVPVKERKEVTEQIKVSSELLDNLVNLAGENSIYRSRVEQQNSDLAAILLEMDVTIARVRDQLGRLDMETQAQIISKHQTETSFSHTDFDPLEMDQYSQLQQLSRSLFESASDLQDLKESLMRRNSDVETLLQQQSRISTELQEGLMRTRMVPLESIAPRLRRLVRQVSTELDKQVDLVISNTAGEMDRSVIEAVVTPLEHMIRNALDHGIESKEVRLAANKPARGTISLDLIREGSEMVLRLKDDGAGISTKTVREKAIAKGLMSADEKLSDNKVLQFVLAAGFSTAKKITQISGRGVGLDVVVNAVKQLGGVLTLDSTEGKGSIFSIRLPINILVSRALIVKVGEEKYAVPMSTVEGVAHISSEQQKELQQFGTAELEYGGETYHVKYLGQLLGSQLSQQIMEEKVPVLLVRSGDYCIALQVDELLPSSEIVVKSLGAQFLSVPAISGATILGDGHVIIILDLSVLVRGYFNHQQDVVEKEEKQIIKTEEHSLPKGPPLVMVVDDSVTVRKVTTRLLERQGMQAITARDGLDAITQLQERIPDIILLDIEMPRMDGFEVAIIVRQDERTKHIPIIMITSRSGEKHRERALAIGVNEYMSKPFMDTKLIKSISDLLPLFEVNLLESSS